MRPLLVAGVAGGVGTSTLTRLLHQHLRVPAHDMGVYRVDVYRGQQVDLLVSSNSAASTSQIGQALSAAPRPPVLVVMNTAVGVIDQSRAHLRMVIPHVSAVFEINHRRSWLEMAAAPGEKLPRAKDLVAFIEGLPAAISAMYAPATAAQSSPVRPPRAAAPIRQTPLMPRAGPTAPPWRPRGAPQAFGGGSQAR